jgi:hypothetical protein
LEKLQNEKYRIVNSGERRDTDDKAFIHNFIINYIKSRQTNALHRQQVISYEFNNDNSKSLLVRFIISNRLPYSFVDNNLAFQQLLNFCCNNVSSTALSIVKLPTRNTVKSLIQKHYNNTKTRVKRILEQQEFISFTTDLWRSETGNILL